MLQNNNTSKILKCFFDNPSKRFQLRELSRITKLSTTAVKFALLELLKQKSILKVIENKYHFYESNKEDENYKFLKKFYNVKLLKESGLIDFLDKEFNYPEAVILFGSASRGEDVENSDFDVFVLTSNKKDFNLEHFEKKLNKSIKIFLMDRNDFELAKKKNPELLNNIINGIIIKGYLQVV